MVKRNLKIFSTPEALASQIADELVNSTEILNKSFYLAISGGSTPKKLFKLLSTDEYLEKIVWEKLNIFWTDERCVPPDDLDSNYGMTKKLLLNQIPIQEKNIYRIKGESNPEIEARRYAEVTKKIVSSVKNGLPQFDWILLGMGSDGHTASLFPKQKLEFTSVNMFGVATHPQSGQKRISMTEALINNSLRVTFLVTGEEKSNTLHKIINESEVSNLPSAKVHAENGIAEWYVDEAAGKLLK